MKESIEHANEVETVLRGPYFKNFLMDLFGNEPAAWHTQLKEQERLRYIVNAFTRMRFCSATGELDLQASGKMSTKPDYYSPWFDWRDPKKDQVNIVFGHWAALGGNCNVPGYYALDTGCAWGHSLTALRLEDKQRFSVPCELPWRFG